MLKIRGLWRQADEETAVSEKTTAIASQTIVNKQMVIAKKPEEIQPKVASKKDDKLVKGFSPQQQGVTRYSISILYFAANMLLYYSKKSSFSVL